MMEIPGVLKDEMRNSRQVIDVKYFFSLFHNIVGQVVSGKTKSGAGGWMLISKRGFRTAWASRRWEKKEAAADYQFQNPVSEHPGQGGEGGKEGVIHNIC